MNIRARILFYFSTISIGLTGALLFFVFTLFSNFREYTFREEQAIKIKTTLKLMAVKKQIDKTLIESIDTITIQELNNEKLMIFDEDKKPVYSSLDETIIPNYNTLLAQLNKNNPVVQKKEETFDVVAIYLEQDGKGYYGICKAYDVYGFKVLKYLKKVFVFGFLGISCLLFILLFYFSGQVTKSILHVTRQIKNFDFEHNNTPITIKNNNDEINLLVARFNKLMTKLNNAYLFQKHAVHHISHELKTPISVLVSNFEKMEKEKDMDTLKQLITMQKEETKSLSDIINALLQIAKMESGKVLDTETFRVDELLFDIADELKNLHPEFQFTIEFSQNVEDESLLSIVGNQRLIKLAFLNLMLNSINYSNNNTSVISIAILPHKLCIHFLNNGNTISPYEQQYIFQHFFRGENSKGIRGFGLGLVMVHKIISLHEASISYQVNNYGLNEFIIEFSV